MNQIKFTTIKDNDDPSWAAYDEVVQQCYFGGTHNNRLHNPRRCYYHNRFGSQYAIRAVAGKARTFQLVKRKWGSNNVDDDAYIYADTSDILNNGVKQKKLSGILDEFPIENTEFVIEEDAFLQGTSAIKFGDYYMKAGLPWSGSGSGYVQLVHQDEISDLPVDQLSFKFVCAKDSAGDFIEQPQTQSHTAAQVTPASCSATSVSVELPSLEAGKYKLTVYDNAGRASGALDIDYKLNFDSISPTRVGYFYGQ